jgi:phosphoribosylpyrophosphate synthetase
MKRQYQKKRICIVIRSTYPPQIGSAWDIVIVVPHMAYGRQDRAVLNGEFIRNIMDAKVVLDI